ncbi:E3 ubiquitin-protein ligase RNF25 [Plodia interpunctella]|uniref:E3 ubiquitin-protein ligase RNF25 n=1 Tax=Plodia interpunctella TaxID=58824 RepID=UPI002367636A|nr:E3 ubiquitin-protein ligase RNF25 [Plodia interpunctella]
MSAPVDERISDEIEALEAILLDDVVIKKVDGIPKIIETVVHPSTGDDVDQQYVCVTLEVKLTPKYPEDSPDVALRNPRGLDDETLATINSQITKRLKECAGQSIVFELIELIRENLTESNLPSGQCVICLYGFVEGDIFIKTKCYHYFHSHCLASHLIAGEKYYQEELDKLPNWQQVQAPPYKQTCPVCRCHVSCDVEALKRAPHPVESTTAPPFSLTAELKALQKHMAALLARQIARGGVVGMGDTGPPPLTITTASDNEDEATNGATCSTAPPPKPPAARPAVKDSSSERDSAPGSPQARAPYKGPYRGFNRRGKPGRRPRGAPR